MSKLLSIIFLVCISFTACQDVPVGYLKATQASYPIKVLNITHLEGVTEGNNPELYQKYKNKIDNQIPWTTTEIQGVLGTDPLNYAVHGVKVLEGGDPEMFRQELTIRGGGRMQMPFTFKSPAGVYSVSVEVSNEGHAYVLEDIFVFVIE